MQQLDPLVQPRDKESFPYSVEISKHFGVLDRVIAWAKTELKDQWRWQLIRPSTDVQPGCYVFYFDSERDYFAFTLKWR